MSEGGYKRAIKREGQKLYSGRLGGRRYWSDVAADFVRPENIYGNMGFRARLWRGFTDWGWGIELETSRPKRCLWFWRRLFQ